jgi:hypothetical protein
MASTRRRIDLTLQVLERPAPGAPRGRSLTVVGHSPVLPAAPLVLRQRSASAGRVQPLEQGKDQLRTAGITLGVDGEPEPRR